MIAERKFSGFTTKISQGSTSSTRSAVLPMNIRRMADREIAPMTRICAFNDRTRSGKTYAGSPSCRWALRGRIFYFVFAVRNRLRSVDAYFLSSGRDTGIATGANAESETKPTRGE